MHRIFLLPALVVIAFVSCEKKAAFEDKYNKSLRIYHNFKAENNNSYTYVTTTSSWTGFLTKTTIYVKNGEVVGRDYVGTQTNYNNGSSTQTIKSEFKERGTEININTEGVKAITLDEVYAKAKNEWLKADKKSNQLFFETKNNGMISSCGYVPNNCADDCFFGMTISEIIPLTMDKL